MAINANDKAIYHLVEHDETKPILGKIVRVFKK